LACFFIVVFTFSWLSPPFLLVLAELILLLVLYDVLIDELGVVDKEPCHFFLEEFHPSSIIFILIAERGLVIEVAAFAIVGLEFLFGGGDVMLGHHIFYLDCVIDVDFHFI
jgi:hypothetical protein